MTTPPSPGVDLGFLKFMFVALLVVGTMVAAIAVFRDGDVSHAASLVSAVMAPASGIVGLIVGHHLGSRRT
jgi:hypothetical protein